MSNSEEYLDDLLKSLDEEGDEQDNGEMSNKEDVTSPNATFGLMDHSPFDGTTDEDDFLKEFEKEMSSDNLTDFLKGFEMNLNEENDSNLDTDNDLIDRDEVSMQQVEEVSGTQDEIEPGEIEEAATELKQPEETEKTEAELQPLEEVEETEAESQLPEEVEETEAEPEQSEQEVEEMSDVPLDMIKEDTLETEEQSSSLDDALNDLMGSDLFDTDTDTVGTKPLDTEVNKKELPEEAKAAENDEDELLALLSDLGDNGDLADIGKMLQADAKNEPIETDSISESTTETDDLSQLADALEALDMGDIPLKEKEKPLEKSVAKEIQTEEASQKSLFQKIVSAIFGPEEEIDEEAEQAELEAETLKKAEKKAEKDAQKEEKKKEQSEKKAEQQKQTQEKKEAKSAQAQEKKEKKLAKLALEPPDKTPKIPKKLIVLVGILAISIFALQSLATNYLGYNTMHNQAQQAYDQGDYLTAYAKMTGETLHTSDKQLFEKAKVLANLQQEYNAYQSLYANKKYQLALDSLIKGLGRYTIYSEQASQLGIADEYNKIQAEIVQALNDQFSLSADQAQAIYNTQTREQYTTQLNSVLSKIGLQ